MEQIPLKAEKRNITGRKVKKLRHDGLIPAHIFGRKITTTHIQVKAGDFDKVFEKAGETGIIDLSVDDKSHPVLIRNTQIHPVTDQILHIDFYQVNLSEKVKVKVPLVIVGEASAVEKKIGLLLTPVSEVEVEALPEDLPENIEVDVTSLENVGDEIKVKDLKVDRIKVEIQAEAELVVVQIGELVTKEMEAVEAEIEAEQAEAIVAAAPSEGAEAEAAAQGTEAAVGEEMKEQQGEEQPSKETQDKPEKQ